MPKIVNLGTPASPTIYTKKYGSFRGVDFSHDASMVDDTHSPEAKNLISDTSGFPEKRPGSRSAILLKGRPPESFGGSRGARLPACLACGVVVGGRGSRPASSGGYGVVSRHSRPAWQSAFLFLERVALRAGEGGCVMGRGKSRDAQ